LITAAICNSSDARKICIVTEEGKNIYPEDIESVFESLPSRNFASFAANYIWPQRSMVGEQLLLALHLEPGQTYTERASPRYFRAQQQTLELQAHSWRGFVERRFSTHSFTQD